MLCLSIRHDRPQIIVQEPKEDAERTILPIIPEWIPGRDLTVPYYQAFEIDGVTTGGLVYRWTEQEGDVPAVLLVPIGVPRRSQPVSTCSPRRLRPAAWRSSCPPCRALPARAAKSPMVSRSVPQVEAEILDLLG